MAGDDAPRVRRLDERERLAGEGVEMEAGHPAALEVVDQRSRVLGPDRHLELADKLLGIAEDDDRVVVARHRRQVREGVQRRPEAPVRLEVPCELLLHRSGRQEQAAGRDLSGQRDEGDVVDERHERSLPRS